MSELNDLQRKIVLAIQRSIVERGCAPSVRELCRITGLTATSSVHYQLEKLEWKGVIKREPGLARAIRVIIPEEDAA